MTDRVGDCWTCGYPSLRAGAHAEWCAGVTALLYRGSQRKRRYVKMETVADYAGLPVGECYRCKANARCERAHIIDRQFGGLDDVQNLVPLCFQCHRDMPPFEAGEESKAWLWLNTRCWDEYLGELVARCLPFLPYTVATLRGDHYDLSSGDIDAALYAAGLAGPPPGLTAQFLAHEAAA